MEGERLARRRPGTRRVAVVAAWVLATLLGLGVAATTRVGPTVLTLSANHGVHLGDVVAFAVAYAAALMITLRLTPRARNRPTQPEAARVRGPGRGA